MTIEDLRSNDLILLECISGSRAYGLNTPQSDTDIKGVFILPKKDFYAGKYIPQISNPTNDIVFYEIGRFIELLSVNNPNILELLNTPKESILYKHTCVNRILSQNILSKLCKNTFGKYAISQIKKARGLNKKILNPVDKVRKNILAFCYVNHNNGSMPLITFLQVKGWNQQDCGLGKIPHMKDLYALYHGSSHHFKGIMQSESSNSLSLSSIPKELDQVCLLYFNKDGYSSYCKDYREYWDWVEKRNNERYERSQENEKNYDAKNMMHTFRLLEMAIEIAKFQEIRVKRPDRDFLLRIKNGEFSYDSLLTLANEKQKELEEAFVQSTLPESPNVDFLKNELIRIREQLYEVEN